MESARRSSFAQHFPSTNPVISGDMGKCIYVKCTPTRRARPSAPDRVVVLWYRIHLTADTAAMAGTRTSARNGEH